MARSVRRLSSIIMTLPIEYHIILSEPCSHWSDPPSFINNHHSTWPSRKAIMEKGQYSGLFCTDTLDRVEQVQSFSVISAHSTSANPVFYTQFPPLWLLLWPPLVVFRVRATNDIKDVVGSLSACTHLPYPIRCSISDRSSQYTIPLIPNQY